MNKTIYSISCASPFADTLAAWIISNYGKNQLTLPRMLVLLPSQRACITLKRAFLQISKGVPTLLPRIQPLGDVDEDVFLSLLLADPLALPSMPPTGFASKRLFVLAHLVRAYQSNIQGSSIRMDHALEAARDIADLLDAVEREGASLANIATLVPESFAAHWQLTHEFLQIIAEHWPAIAREKHLVSPEEWRGAMLHALSAYWQSSPPDYPVIAAGTTGSIASTAALLKTIAGLPQGAVVLPGLDMQASDAYFESIAESHPQWGMRELLATLDAERKDVKVLDASAAGPEYRSVFLSRALCPAEVLHEWRQDFSEITHAVQGLSFIACADHHEEATTIALLLREALQTPAKTAALVTHDRPLARRVAAQMQRFGVQVDDSAGTPLTETPAGAFLRLVLNVAESNAAPLDLLAMLKHPLARVGMERIACLEDTRELELAVLRGICPSSGLEGLHAAVKNMHKPAASLEVLLRALDAMLSPLLSAFALSSNGAFADMLEAHLLAAEKLSDGMLWQGRETETLSALVDELRDAATDAAMMEMASYPAIFELFLAGKVMRPEYGMHPRLMILSPLEARLQSCDRIILGGMNEGSWPQETTADPWFNRSMRKAIGLSVPERQTGQAAHDFVVLAHAPEVFITRAEKVDGSPVSPSRWWVRLMTLLEHYGAKDKVMPRHYLHWAAALDTSDEITPCARPEPVPPVSARPHTIAVTQVETLLANPYVFYAANILRLRALKEIDQNPEASDFGIMVHKIFERFVKLYSVQLPPDSLDVVLRLGRDAFAELQDIYPVVQAWWWPRFEQVATWMIRQEQLLRSSLAHVWAEVSGDFVLDGCTFTGRADRIEVGKQGGLAIVDYKTGGAHTVTDTRNGNAVQLMLLALIATQGKWEADIKEKQVRRLEYWIAGGGRNNGEIRPVDAEKLAEYISSAKEKLSALIAQYQNADQHYRCAANMDDLRSRDFLHLARVQEWR